MAMEAKEQTIFHHTGEIIQTNDREIKIVKRLEEPLIIVMESVLSDEECDQLIELSKERLNRSKIASHKVNEIRTSSSMFFKRTENELVQKIENRVADIMGIPVEYGEEIQILQYKPGQQYKEHHDYFAPTSKAASNNRISTLILYLNDVEKGGETYFPLVQNPETLEKGFSVSPKKGSAFYFEYFYNDPELNQLTLHGGAPVIKGTKWAATQWMRKQKLEK